MKKFLTTILLLTAAAGLAVRAQDNPYAIDNECYKYFAEAETAVEFLDTDEFETANSRLLSTAIEKKDEKARTLYYVGQLKRISRLGRAAPDSERMYWNEQVDKAMAELQSVAKETGYIQYYYYSFDLAQNYYFNSGQQIRGTQLLTKMMEDSRNAGDEYGMWQSLRYISALYGNMNDYINLRGALMEVIRIYTESKDPFVRRQSMTRSFCDLADTYPVGSDSARMYYDEGSKYASTHFDTLRVNYYYAQLAALDKKTGEYRKLRDWCMAEKAFIPLFRSADIMFDCTDKILDRRFRAEDMGKLDSLKLNQQLAFINTLAADYGYWEVSERALRRMYDHSLENLSKTSSRRLEEVSAQYDKMNLDAKLAQKSHQITRITVLVAVLLTIILVGALIFTWIHVRSLRRSNKKDEQRIAELQEANEKVRMADAAKTRFVQNMSHEVRTPLNAIVGFSQLLSLPDGSFPEQEKEEFASYIVNNTKMLTMLLDDILNASAMDNGDYRISYEEGECGFMCQAAISSAEHRLQSGVTMRYVPEFEGQFSFVTDPRRVQQILINLLTNACKHTASGEIVLACSLDENPGEVTYSVTDTGTGIPADQAEKIFERFTKLDDFVQGTGLGLSICRDIAGKMGARVFLDTTYDKGGARFVFVLPVNPLAEETTVQI